MATLLHHARQTGLALLIVLSLIAVSPLVRPLVGDKLAQFLLNVEPILADNPPGSH